jgi:hypothetical protein
MLVKVFGWQQSLLITSFVVILGFVLWFFVKPDKALV